MSRKKWRLSKPSRPFHESSLRERVGAGRGRETGGMVGPLVPLTGGRGRIICPDKLTRGWAWMLSPLISLDGGEMTGQ